MPLSFTSVLRGGLMVACLLSPVAPLVAVESFFGVRVDAVDPKDPGVAATLERARRIADGPVIRRVYSVDDMFDTADRRTANVRAKANAVRERLGAEAAGRFALASADMGNARQILEELPLIAAAWRLTGERPLRAYLCKQLEEVVTWTPFQRPGWTLSNRKDPLPPEGDGVWLATGTLLQALAITLDVLPSDSLPSGLLDAVRARMAEEVMLTFHDWSNRVPWYVVQGKANSNQWVVPASGMVVGAAVLKREELRPAYDLGVASLRRSLALAGDDGSLSEGFAYGMSWTSFSLLLAECFMEQAGDASFADVGFFRRFPDWMALYLQPGGNAVNAFDAYGGQRGSVSLALTDLTRVAAVSGSGPLIRVVMREAGRLRHDFFGLLASGVLHSDRTAGLPPTAGLFQRSRMFVWRTSWDENASGLWVRGGDEADFHDHYDRGHVNFVVGGTPVLIEAGTPGYAEPKKRSDYDSAAGHNTLIVNGNIFPNKAPAEIVVERQDSSGGRLRVNLSKVYPSLDDAVRSVEWTATTLAVGDSLRAPVSVRARWNWHLATAEQPVVVQIDPLHVQVRVPAGAVVFPAWVGPWSDPDSPRPEAPDVFKSAAIDVRVSADRPIVVAVAWQADHTLKFRRPDNRHPVLLVCTRDEVPDVTVQTSFEVVPVVQQ